jgi:hypothetical protein
MLQMMRDIGGVEMPAYFGKLAEAPGAMHGAGRGLTPQHRRPSPEAASASRTQARRRAEAPRGARHRRHRRPAEGARSGPRQVPMQWHGHQPVDGARPADGHA